MTSAIVVLTTCSDAGEADRIARSLIENRLAACVQVLPQIRSIYRWKDAIESAEEHLLLIKSTSAKFSAIRASIESLHSYEVPEIVALPIEEGSTKYMNWLETELNG